MAVKKTTYSEVELMFAEKQLEEWKEYVEAHPLATLTDRVSYKETKSGGVIPMVIASIEQQGKFIQDTMKNYLALLREVEGMRKLEEDKQKAVRGNQTLSPAEAGLI